LSILILIVLFDNRLFLLVFIVSKHSEIVRISAI
jgi:hypothetical protein